MKLTKFCLKLFFLTLIVFLNLSLVRTASAITITDTEWHELTWSQGNTILNRFNREGAFTFNVLTGGSATLQVTDIGFNFERYEVFNFGIWNGLWTTSPTGSLVNTLFTTSFDVAYNGARNWSIGSMALTPGDYSLTFQIQRWNTQVLDPSGKYMAGFRILGDIASPAPIPEPSTMLLMGTGLLVLFFYVWRRERLQQS